MKNIIKQTAKQYGVTVKEVRRDIAEMIKVGIAYSKTLKLNCACN